MSRRLIVAVVAAVVAVNLALALAEALAPGSSGPRSSSLATAPDGFAAWAQLAQRNGVRVVALRDALDEARLPPGATVVALDVPGLPRADARVLRRFADSGGHVVAGGERPGSWLGVFDGGLSWRPSGPRDAVAGARRLRTAGQGSWIDGGLLVRRGTVSLVADASPLQNARLADADNAAFALDLAGRGPLVFAESAHGYDAATGPAALPAAAKWSLGLLLAAALLLMAARGRRFGPPEAQSRPLAPPRADYIDALASALMRTKDPAGAMAPVRDALLAKGVEAEAPRDDAQALALARQHAETETTQGASP